MVSLIFRLIILLFFFKNLSLGVSAAESDYLVEPGSRDNADGCTCFLVSGPDLGYFQYHRFFDFRNIPNDGDNDYTVAPDLITDSKNQGGQNVTSAFLDTDKFNNNWAIQNGLREADRPVKSVDSAQNVYISRNSSVGVGSPTYLTLRANRLPGFMSTAEIDSNQRNLLYSSIRTRLRIVPHGLSNTPALVADSSDIIDKYLGSRVTDFIDSGAVLGVFTYFSDTEESDTEILTRDATDQIHYSNQPDYNSTTDTAIDDASTQCTLPNAHVWTQWLNHRIDWFDGISRWYVNDEFLLNKSTNVPKTPSGLVINLWSDGGNWSGDMATGGQVIVGIEWIEMVFNISGNVRGPETTGLKEKIPEICDVGCNIDGVGVVGYPEIAFNATTNSAWSRVEQETRKVVVYTGAIMMAASILAI